MICQTKKIPIVFRLEDASGSTSQAAGIVEAMEAGSHVFLLDEDTSATNFMLRDALMQQAVEPGQRTDHAVFIAGRGSCMRRKVSQPFL